MSDSHSPSPPPPLPSPQEFSCIITDPDMVDTIARRFTSKPTSTAVLRYYSFLSQNIEIIEQQLEQHHMEREAIYTHLFESRSFRTRIRPIVSEWRHRQAQIRRGFHPYDRPTSLPRYPSDDNIISPPSGTTNNEELGTKENPMIIVDGEEGTADVEKKQSDRAICSRCNQLGHLQEDCDTLMRTLTTHCDACNWTKQDECDHYDVSPAWIRRQQLQIEQRDRRQ